MTEPTSTTTAAALAGTGITIAGITAGMPFEMLMPAFVGALCSIRWSEEGRLAIRVGQVFAGTMLAVWSAYPLAAIVAGMLPSSVNLPHEWLRAPVAYLVGWGGMSIGLRWIGRKLGEPQQ